MDGLTLSICRTAVNLQAKLIHDLHLKLLHPIASFLVAKARDPFMSEYSSPHHYEMQNKCLNPLYRRGFVLTLPQKLYSIFQGFTVSDFYIN